MVDLSYEDFLARLDPKTAKRIKTASEVETVRYPVASLGLTRALGGGIGAGRMTLVYGNTSSGKSLLMLQTIGKLQKMGLSCGYFDAEQTYDQEFARKLGVDNEELILEQPKTFGRAADLAAPLLRAGLDILVIDSISDLLPEVFVGTDGQVNDFEKMKQMGAHAKSNTIMLNALHYSNERTALVLLSQTTTEIGQTYTKQIPHGGKKMLFSPSQIIKLTSSATDAKQIKGEITVGTNQVMVPVGRKVEALVEKNKLGVAFTKAQWDMYYGREPLGIDLDAEIIDLAIYNGQVITKGSWYYYDDQVLQGRDTVIDYILDNNKLDELTEKILGT